MWKPSPYVLFRLAGKQQNVVQQLKLKKTAELLDRYHQTLSWLNNNKAPVCEQLLFEEIGKHDGEVKSSLVAIKRALYNFKVPKKSELETLNVLDSNSRRRVLQFCARIRNMGRFQQAAEQQFDQEHTESCRNLQAHSSDSNFLKTLQVAQPSFTGQVERLLSTAPEKWKKQQRQTALTVSRYLMRMATKTSPFGRFGPIALGQFNEQSDAVVEVNYQPEQNRTKAFLNHMVVDRLNKAVSENPAVYRYVPIRMNQTLSIEENQAKFLQPREVGGFPPYTRFRKGNVIPIIEAVVNAYNDRTQYLIADLVEQVCNTEATHQSNPAEVEALLESLIRSGMLIREFAIYTDQQARLSQLIELLPVNVSEDVDALTASLNKLAGIERQFAHIELSKRKRFAKEAQQIVNAILGPKYRIADSDNIFIEDTYCESSQFQLGQKFYNSIAEDVSLFLDCIYNRDEGGLNHVMFKDIFINTFGEGGQCDDINGLCQLFSNAIFGGNYDDRDVYKKSALVNDKSMTYMQSLLEEIDKSPESKVCSIDKAKMRRMVDTFYNQLSDVSDKSVTLHLQVTSDSVESLEAGDFNVVLNYTLPGYGRFFTRYCQLYEDSTLSEQIQQRVAQLSSHEGAEFKEVLSTLNHNAQVHPITTDTLVELPGESASASSEQVLSANDISIRHCPEKDALQFSAQGQCFTPLYMGFFHGMALPAYHRLFLDSTPYGYHAERVKPVEFRENILPFVTTSDNEQLIRHYPRLQVGNLVIQRETWCVDIAAFPEMKSTTPPYQLFKSLYLWHKENSLPRECFIRIKRESSGPQENIFSQDRIAHKPIYFDFENIFTVKDLARLLAKGTVISIQFEEALPSVSSSFVTDGESGVAAELQIEFNRQEAARAS